MAITDNTAKWKVKKVAGGTSPVMEGATATEDGKEGLVPAPAKGDENKFLSGDGTYKEAGAVKSVNGQTGDVVIPEPNYPVTSVNGMTGAVKLYQYSTTDLTAGSSTLTTGQLYLVYE